MHPLYGALSVPYVPVLVTCGALVSQRYTYAPPRCRTSQYRMTFIFLTVSMWNDNVGLAGFKRRANAFSIGLSYYISLFVFSNFPALFLLFIGWYCGAGVFRLLGCRSLFSSLALPTTFNNINNNILKFIFIS